MRHFESCNFLSPALKRDFDPCLSVRPLLSPTRGIPRLHVPAAAPAHTATPRSLFGKHARWRPGPSNRQLAVARSGGPHVLLELAVRCLRVCVCVALRSAGIAPQFQLSGSECVCVCVCLFMRMMRDLAYRIVGMYRFGRARVSPRCLCEPCEL